MSYYDESILSLGGVYTYTLRQGRTSEVVTRKKKYMEIRFKVSRSSNLGLAGPMTVNTITKSFFCRG